jgi:hypothetical protein
MLDQRSNSDRRDMDDRRQRMERRMQVVTVNLDRRRVGCARREVQQRRIHIDRRTAAATFLDIA